MNLHPLGKFKFEAIIEHKTYTEDLSGGVAKGGFGYFSSSVCVITSESATHCSSNLTTGTFPSELISKNLHSKEVIKKKKEQTNREKIQRFAHLKA